MRPEEAHRALTRAMGLEFAGRFTEAGSLLRQLVLRAPGHHEAAFAYAQHLLLQGNWRDGWPLWEARLHLPFYAETEALSRIPPWRGEDPSGRVVLVSGDMGFGDQIMAARYLPLLAERGALPLMLVHPCLKRLFACLKPPVLVRAHGEGIPLPDLAVRAMSLPSLFATTFESVPSGRVLAAETELVDAWRHRLAGPGLSVGLAWRGNAVHPRNEARSLPLADLAPLFRVPGVRICGLLVGEEVAAEADRLDPGFGFVSLAGALDRGGDALVDTAAVIAGLDLVISVDTAIAHLAGALGRPTWLLLPFVPDWRWLLERNDTPWYDTLTLFRQPAAGQWRPVIERVAALLKEFASGPA